MGDQQEEVHQKEGKASMETLRLQKKMRRKGRRNKKKNP